VGVARGSFFPAVDLSYSKRLDNTTIPVPVSDTDRSGQLQVSFDIPLGGKNLGRHTEAVERHQAAQADADDLMLKVSKDITDLQRQYNEARQIAPLLEQRVAAAQRVSAAYELHFEAGRRSLNDLSITQDDLFNAQRALIENRAQQTTLQAQLLGLAGELRSALRTRYRPAPIAPELLGTTYVPPALAAAPVPTVDAAGAADRTRHPARPARRHRRTRPARPPRGLAGRLERPRLRRLPRLLHGRLQARQGPQHRRLGSRAPPAPRRSQVAIAAHRGLRLKARGPDRSSTVFVQHYRAGNYRDTVRKQLDWVKVDGQWKIAAETVLAAAQALPRLPRRM
jgi:hypothetical protein